MGPGHEPVGRLLMGFDLITVGRVTMDLHAQDIGAQMGEGFDIAIGIGDHQMHVQRFGGMFGDDFYHRDPIRNIRNEQAIHHIDVVPIGIPSIYHFNITLQIAKIGGQKRRCYFNFIHFR